MEYSYAYPTDYDERPTYIRWIVIVFIVLMVIAAIVISIVVAVSVSTHADNVVVYANGQGTPFNVTYRVGSQSGRSLSDLGLDIVDRIKMAHSFENGLNLTLKNILHIRNISQDTVVESNSTSRRKRSVQCDQDLNDTDTTALIFNFNLTYPLDLECQSEDCINQTFHDIYERFKTKHSLNIDFNNVSRALSLCSFGVLSYTSIQPTLPDIYNLTTVLPTDQQSTMTTSSTAMADVQVSTTMMIDTSTTIMPDMDQSTTTMIIDTSTTIMPDVDQSTTIIVDTDTPDEGVSTTIDPNATDAPDEGVSTTTIDPNATDAPDEDVSTTIDPNATDAPQDETRRKKRTSSRKRRRSTKVLESMQKLWKVFENYLK